LRKRDLIAGSKAEDVGAVVDSHDNDILVRSEYASVVVGVSSVAELQRATVDPEQDWTAIGWCWRRWSVDVQVQAVFRLLGVVAVKHGFDEIRADLGIC
jgi:hypothetical protein